MTSIDPKLQAGAQWARVKDGESSISTVLCVTNLNIKAKLQAQFPPVVVVLTDSGKILHHPMDVFTKTRQYVGEDEFVSKRMNEIITGVSEDEPTDDDLVDIEKTPVGVDPAFEALIGGVTGDATDDGDGEDDGDESVVLDDPAFTEGSTVVEDSIPVFYPAEHDGLRLDTHFLSYTEAPFTWGSKMAYVLRFILDRELNMDHVSAIFDPKIDSAPTLTSVVVDSHAARIELDNIHYEGAYLEIDASGNGVAAVYLTTPKAAPATPADPASAATPVTGGTVQASFVIPQLSTTPVVSSTPSVQAATSALPAGNSPVIGVTLTNGQ